MANIHPDSLPIPLTIDNLSHDGRGVARYAFHSGKVIFVDGALPGERIKAKIIARKRRFDLATLVEVVQPSVHRVEPRCRHFGVCAGCVLQHLNSAEQIVLKQQILLDNLQRIGHVHTELILEPLTADHWEYRRKGRLSVRFVEKKQKVVIGFREKNPRFVADLSVCHTLVAGLGHQIASLHHVLNQLEGRRAIPQVEFSCGDDLVAITIRHLSPLTQSDLGLLIDFVQRLDWLLFLQPNGPDSVHRIWPEQASLSYALRPWNLSLEFQPLDFIQVNASLNQKMITQALAWLKPGPDDRVLDLFCGLGNFSLPLARYAGQVVGIEGSAALVERANANAQRNRLTNVSFYRADLSQDQRLAVWMDQPFSLLLLDPPRSGAIDVLRQLPIHSFVRIVYISCHPGSLARDADYLVNQHGFHLRAVGVMDMFAQTMHVESMAVFEAR